MADPFDHTVIEPLAGLAGDRGRCTRGQHCGEGLSSLCPVTACMAASISARDRTRPSASKSIASASRRRAGRSCARRLRTLIWLCARWQAHGIDGFRMKLQKPDNFAEELVDILRRGRGFDDPLATQLHHVGRASGIVDQSAARAARHGPASGRTPGRVRPTGRLDGQHPGLRGIAASDRGEPGRW